MPIASIFNYIGVIVLVVLVLILVVSNIHVVQQSRAYVVERLGAYSATWNVGLHLKIPFIERVVKKVSLKEQVADFDPQPVITKDNVTMQIDTVIYFQITDPKLYTYGVEHPMNAIENLTATTLRNIIGEMELDQSLTSRDVINAKMRSILDEATDPWGIKVNRVELKNILPPREIQNAMEKQMKAERERRESILQADHHARAHRLGGGHVVVVAAGRDAHGLGHVAVIVALVCGEGRDGADHQRAQQHHQRCKFLHRFHGKFTSFFRQPFRCGIFLPSWPWASSRAFRSIRRRTSTPASLKHTPGSARAAA